MGLLCESHEVVDGRRGSNVSVGVRFGVVFALVAVVLDGLSSHHDAVSEHQQQIEDDAVLQEQEVKRHAETQKR